MILMSSRILQHTPSVGYPPADPHRVHIFTRSSDTWSRLDNDFSQSLGLGLVLQRGVRFAENAAQMNCGDQANPAWSVGGASRLGPISMSISGRLGWNKSAR